MNNQKVNFIPTYNGVPITDYTPEEGSILLDVIDMPEANKAWSIHVMSEGTGRIKILAGNSLDLDFVFLDMLSLNFDPDIPAIISDIEFNYRYMRLDLEFDGDIGSISISMVK